MGYFWYPESDMDTRRQIKDLFHFNRGERGGLVVLLLILAGNMAATLVIPHLDVPAEYDFTEFEQVAGEIEARRTRDSLAKAELRQMEWRKASRDRPRYPDNPPWSSRKGRAPYPAGAGPATGTDRDPPAKADSGALVKNHTAGTRNTAPADTGLVLELNAADSLDLQQLRGIGPSFSRRIVKYRQMLGGYARKEQLLEVYGMDSARYAMISDHLVVDTARLHKINLNTATIKELMRHPYIEFYVAKLLVTFRERTGQVGSFAQLEANSGIPPDLLRRIRPYLAL